MYAIRYCIRRKLLNVKLSSGYYICLGMDSSRLKKGSSGVPSIIMNVTFLLHVTIYLRIFVYKLKGLSLIQQNTKSSTIKNLFLGDMEGQSVTTYTSHVLGIIILGISAAMFSKLNGVEPKDLNSYPYNLIIYYKSLVAPSLGIFALVMSTSKRRIYLKTFLEELKSLYF